MDATSSESNGERKEMDRIYLLFNLINNLNIQVI